MQVIDRLVVLINIDIDQWYWQISYVFLVLRKSLLNHVYLSLPYWLLYDIKLQFIDLSIDMTDLFDVYKYLCSYLYIF